MKTSKKNTIVIVCLVLVLAMFWLLNTDKYIRNNIRTIDKADKVYIIAEENSVSYPFDEEIFKFVSYGGSVVKVDNFFEALFKAYSTKLTKIDMKIKYTKGESTLAIADVYKSNENSGEYILYLNNVYWRTHSKLADLLDLVE